MDAPFGSLSAGSLTVPADYVGNSLGLTGYTALYFLNSAANNAPWQVSYSFSAAFSVGSGDSSALFTTGADEVNFNALTTSRVQAITADAGLDLYHSLGGADEVWLPANGTALVPGITWDSSHVFSIGALNSVVPPGNDGATVHSGPSNDRIDGAYETNAQFGGGASQRGNIFFTNGDTVEYTGSFKDFTIKELTARPPKESSHQSNKLVENFDRSS